MTEQRQQLENQPPAGPMYQWALDWYNAQDEKQHSLTDEMCEVIATESQWAGNDLQCATDIAEQMVGTYGMSDIRAAADWQLEKVLEYIVANDWFAEPGWRIAELRKAMRPQEDN